MLIRCHSSALRGVLSRRLMRYDRFIEMHRCNVHCPVIVLYFNQELLRGVIALIGSGP